jgi:hypothetical protein
MTAGENRDDLTPAEQRLAQHLQLLRSSPPTATPYLVPRVIRGVRWQRAVRDPLLFVGAVAAALAESLGLLMKPRGGRS